MTFIEKYDKTKMLYKTIQDTRNVIIHVIYTSGCILIDSKRQAEFYRVHQKKVDSLLLICAISN